MKEKLLKWLRAAGVRALKTVAQTAVATIGTGAVISEVDWRMVLSAACSRCLPAWRACRRSKRKRQANDLRGGEKLNM